MDHPFYKILSVKTEFPYWIEVIFDDGVSKKINLEPILYGEMYGPLKDKLLFGKVCVDAEVGTIQWPNGADFDPPTLRHWEENSEELSRRAKKWGQMKS